MADQGRKAHVYRVYSKDADGADDPDVWIDVMRIDKLSISMGGMKSGKTGQIVRYEMDWGRDTPESTPLRKYSKLTVKQPDGGVFSVDLPIVKEAKLLFGGMDDGTTGQLVKFVFDTSPDNQKRKSTPIRVVNNDLGKAVDLSGGAVGWDDYKQALSGGTKDDTQYVDAEVTDKFTLSTPQEMVGAADGTTGQMTVYELDNEEVERLFDKPSDGAAPPYLTDPLQTIVNVSWKPGLAVEFFDGAD